MKIEEPKTPYSYEPGEADEEIVPRHESIDPEVSELKLVTFRNTSVFSKSKSRNEF